MTEKMCSRKNITLLLRQFCLLTVFMVCEFNLNPAIAADSKPEKAAKPEKKVKLEKVEKEEIVGENSNIDSKKFENEVAQTKFDTLLIIDSSRSMQRTDPQKLRLQGAKLFSRFLTQGDRLAIYTFDKTATLSMPFTDISQTNLENIDKAINAVPEEGGFTDIEAAVHDGFKYLLENGRKDAAKTVILLSDGKMDPHPSRGTPDQATSEMFREDLPQYKDKGVRIYSVSLSEESDRELLSKIAEYTGGINLYASDSATIHKKFSELFLTLKQPQVAPMEGSGFEIDNSVKEATFYISKKEGNVDYSLVDPKGIEIKSDNLPTRVKWFTGDLFDLITIYQPQPGKWTIKGIENPEGFVSLLSDINFQVKFPGNSFRFGEKIAVYAHLNNAESELKDDINSVTFYNYKILDMKDGSSVQSGTLEDKGENGDNNDKDGIFSGIVKFEKEGDFQIIFGITAPTFNRQQRFSFNVAKELIEIKTKDTIFGRENGEEESPDNFTDSGELKKYDLLQALITEEGEKQELGSIKVQAIVKGKEGKSLDGLFLTKDKDNPFLYEIPVQKFKPGTFEVYVKMTAINKENKEIKANSSSITYVVPDWLSEEERKNEELRKSNLVGMICSGVSVFWIFLLLIVSKIIKSRLTAKDISITTKKIEPALLEKIQVLKTNLPEQRRKANKFDKEIFHHLGEELESIPTFIPKTEASATEAETPAEEVVEVDKDQVKAE
ncbi:MAG: VWA domain-containing protein [Proteobacteria bacterium]|nr:VWA domain-containing protein [Pseudomonadota bacterium]